MNTIFKTVALCISVLFAPSFAQAQVKGPAIEFKKTIHDFGNIAEKGGTATCTFVFTNTGTAPLIINNVSASCGCTTPDWSKAPVAPGKTGFVKVTYDPDNRPYPFDKTITVSTNGSPSQVVLHIKGNVTAKSQSIEEQYPAAAGNARFKKGEIAFPRSNSTATPTETLEVINTGSTPVIISFEKVPAHIRMVAEPISLGANQKGLIKCTYLNAAQKEFGPVTDVISVKANTARTTIKIKANIEEDFSKLTKADLDKAPIATLKASSINFGTLKQRSKTTATLTITNTGKSDLIIRKVVADCDCIESATKNLSIKPNQSADVTVTINGSDGTGDKFYALTIVSNAPQSQNLVTYITGKVN